MIYIKPGEHYFGEFTQDIKTVLGSCASVVILSRNLKFVAFTHAIMPEGDGFRYADYSTREALNFIKDRTTEFSIYITGNIKTGGISIGRENLSRIVPVFQESGHKYHLLKHTNGCSLLLSHTQKKIFFKEFGNEKRPEPENDFFTSPQNGKGL